MSRGFVGLEGSEIDFCWVSRGLGGSGFGVKSVFAGCLDGLATFVDWFVNAFLIVLFFGLACGLEGCFCWVSRGFGWFTPFAYRAFSAPCLDKLISELG